MSSGTPSVTGFIAGLLLLAAVFLFLLGLFVGKVVL